MKSMKPRGRLFVVWMTILLPGSATIPCTAQNHSQLRLKLGMVNNFSSPSRMSVGYAYLSSLSRSPYPVFGLEYSQPFKKTKGFLFGGVSMDIQTYYAVINGKNISVTYPGGTPGIVTYVFKPYAGVESRFSPKELPSYKNYFSWFGALGLTINPFSGNGQFATGNYDRVTDPSGYGTTGITSNGQTFKGTQVYLRNATNFSPALIAGIRWHVRNKRGSDVLTVELLGNYGLIRYYNYENHYRLDDVPMIDRLGQKGIYVQLNVLIPLANFGKKKVTNSKPGE